MKYSKWFEKVKKSKAFLAAMSSSRSDIVIQFVCALFCVCVLSFSFSVLGVLKSFDGVSNNFKGCFKDV